MRGSYLLLMELKNTEKISVGKLGKIDFKKSFYIYVGSALNGLDQRIQRHLRKQKKTYWHIDYLLGNAEAKVLSVFYKQGDKTEECAVAQIISERGRDVVGFGASDCNCRSHLFRIDDYGFLKKFMHALIVET